MLHAWELSLSPSPPSSPACHRPWLGTHEINCTRVTLLRPDVLERPSEPSHSPRSRGLPSRGSDLPPAPRSGPCAGWPSQPCPPEPEASWGQAERGHPQALHPLRGSGHSWALGSPSFLGASKTDLQGEGAFPKPSPFCSSNRTLTSWGRSRDTQEGTPHSHLPQPADGRFHAC